MAKVELTKEERRFDAMGVAASLFAHALRLKRKHTDDEVEGAIGLIQQHDPRLVKWLEEKLHEVNNS